MEIDVTHMVEDADNMPNLSGSKMELGDNAGRITWNNSKAYGAEHPLLADDDARDAARAHFRAYGAWSEEEIAAWSEEDLQAMVCQDVAAAIRGMESCDDYRIYKGDDGRWWFVLGG